MDAQSIVDRIDRDARAYSTALLQEAKQKAAAIQDASERKIAKEREATLAQTERDITALEDRMQRMALLEARKQDLSAKRAVLDEAFQKTLEKMLNMSQADARAFGLSMLLSCAMGNETVIPDRSSAWCDAAFVSAANSALVKAGKPGQITLSSQKRDVGGGFVLARDGMEINCSFKAAIDTQRLELEAEVATLLFS